MQLKFSAKNRLAATVTFTTVFSLAFLAITYYFYYAPGREQSIIERNFRQLNVARMQIKSTIDFLYSNFEKLNSNFPKRNKSDTTQIRQNVELVRGFELLGKSESGDTPLREGATVRVHQGVAWLTIVVKNPTELIVEARLDSLLQNVIPLSGFAYWFLVTSRGSLIFETEKALLGKSVVDSVTNDKGKKVSFRAVSNLPSVVSMSIAGEEYRMLHLPLDLQTTDSSGTNLCGLISTKDLSRESREVSYNVLMFIVLIIVLAFLCWPIIRIEFMEPSKEIKPLEVFFAILSAMIGVALLTLALADGFSFFYTLGEDLDTQLQEYAESVEQHFSDELDMNLVELKKFGDTEKKKGSFTKVLEGEGLTNKGSKYSFDYPYFKVMFVLDSNGTQVLRWGVSDSATLKDLSFRTYFKNAKDGRLWPHFNEKDNRLYQCWLEPNHSVTTNTFGVSMSISPKSVTGTPSGIPVLDFQPMSLYEPVTISGFGFCVIDQNGKVLFHSDKRKNLTENFFDECENDKNLRSLVVGHHADAVSVRYWNRNHRLWVQPLHDFPWTIITFYDEKMTRALNLEVVTVTMALVVLYAFILFVVFNIFWRDHGWHARWSWPNPQSGEKYLPLCTCALFLSFSMLVFRVVFAADPDLTLIAAIIMPLFGLGLCHAILREVGKEKEERTRQFIKITGKFALVCLIIWVFLFRLMPTVWVTMLWCLGTAAIGLAFLLFGRSWWGNLQTSQNIALSVIIILVYNIVSATVVVPGLETSWVIAGAGMVIILAAILLHKMKRGEGWWRKWHGVSLNYVRAYSIVLTCLLMLVVVQPTITFFKIAQESQTLFFVRQEQSNLSEELNNRDDRIRKKYEEIPSVDKELTRKRLANTLDVYADYFFGTKYSSDPLTGGSVGSDQSDPFVHKVLRLIMPLYDEYSVQARAFTSNQADDGLWCWTQVPDSGIGDGWGRQRAQLLRRFPLQNVVRSIGTSLPAYLQLPKNGTWPILVLVVLVVFGVIFLVYLSVRLLVKMLFHASEDDPARDGSQAPSFERSIIVHAVSDSSRDKLINEIGRRKIKIFDLVKTGGSEIGADAAPRGGTSIVIDHFEYQGSDAKKNVEKLELLEKLVYTHHCQVTLISSLDPRGFFDAPDVQKPEGRVDWVRWTRLMRMFERKWLGVGEGSDWQRVWLTLSGSERRVLFFIWFDTAMFAPKNTKSVATLLNVGLIKRDPALTLFNPEFEEVVRSSYHLSDIAVDPEETEASFWAKIRVPVALLVLGIIVFLFVTQKEFFQSTMAIMTIAAGLIPLLAKLLATIQSPQK